MNGQLLSVNELRAKRAIIVTIKSGAVTVGGNTQSTPVRVSQFREANFFLDLTAKAGTLTFNISVFTKDPVSGKWFLVVAFTQASDVTSEMKTVAANLGEYISATWTIGAATSVTFSLSAVLKV
jgi:hypothetical protein